jgi:hypothetical protein
MATKSVAKSEPVEPRGPKYQSGVAITDPVRTSTPSEQLDQLRGMLRGNTDVDERRELKALIREMEGSG